MRLGKIITQAIEGLNGSWIEGDHVHNLDISQGSFRVINGAFAAASTPYSLVILPTRIHRGELGKNSG